MLSIWALNAILFYSLSIAALFGLYILLFFGISSFIIGIIRFRKRTLIISSDFIQKETDFPSKKKNLYWKDIKEFHVDYGRLTIQSFDKNKIRLTYTRDLCKRNDWEKVINEFLKYAKIKNFKFIESEDNKIDGFFINDKIKELTSAPGS